MGARIRRAAVCANPVAGLRRLREAACETMDLTAPTGRLAWTRPEATPTAIDLWRSIWTPRNASLQIQPTRAKSTCGTAAMAHFGLPKPNVSTKPSQTCTARSSKRPPSRNAITSSTLAAATAKRPATPHGWPRKVPLGVDLSSQMIAFAQGMAAAEGLTNIEFRQADAQIHPFESAAFDIVISRMGSMFFGDPISAFSNLRQALRPQGRLTLLTWQSMSENEWLTEFASLWPSGGTFQIHLPKPPARSH